MPRTYACIYNTGCVYLCTAQNIFKSMLSRNVYNITCKTIFKILIVELVEIAELVENQWLFLFI